MRKVINGVAYDTETAELVARVDHGHESSQAWWALHRNQAGVFFEVVADHDGVVDGCYPLSSRQAQQWLERHANHLVEIYFGPMPEAEPNTIGQKFSRRTILAAVDVMEGAGFSNAELTRCFLKWGPELAKRCNDGSEPHRYNHLIKFFDEEPDRSTADGEPLAAAIVATAIAVLPKAEVRADFLGDGKSPPGPAFRRALALDGFTIWGGAIIRTLPAELDLPAAQDDVTGLLTKHGLKTPKGHLDQALDAHGRGEWASANSQLRSFYESLLDEIAMQIVPPEIPMATSENRRAALARVGFLREDLNEWGNNGKNFINGLFKRLHGEGSHPGLSDQEDSTFRRHIVLITARLILVRFDKWSTTL